MATLKDAGLSALDQHLKQHLGGPSRKADLSANGVPMALSGSSSKGKKASRKQDKILSHPLATRSREVNPNMVWRQ